MLNSKKEKVGTVQKVSWVSEAGRRQLKLYLFLLTSFIVLITDQH